MKHTRKPLWMRLRNRLCPSLNYNIVTNWGLSYQKIQDYEEWWGYWYDHYLHIGKVVFHWFSRK